MGRWRGNTWEGKRKNYGKAPNSSQALGIWRLTECRFRRESSRAGKKDSRPPLSTMKRSWLWWGPLPEIQFALVPAADHVTCAWLIRQLPLSHFVLFCFACLFDVLSRTRESSVCVSFCSEGWERWWWWWVVKRRPALSPPRLTSLQMPRREGRALWNGTDILTKKLISPLNANKEFPIRSAVATPGSLDARFRALRLKPYFEQSLVEANSDKNIYN